MTKAGNEERCLTFLFSNEEKNKEVNKKGTCIDKEIGMLFFEHARRRRTKENEGRNKENGAGLYVESSQQIKKK